MDESICRTDQFLVLRRVAGLGTELPAKQMRKRRGFDSLTRLQNIISPIFDVLSIGPILIGMHYLIYKITNKLNNKIYVGKHKTKNKDDEYFGSGLLLGRAVEKHGKENFTKELLFECKSEEEMNEKETDIVDEDFIARPDTYNIKLGGCGGFDHINKNRLNRTPSAIENHRKNNNTKNGTSRFVWLMENDLEFRKEQLEKCKRASEFYKSINGAGFRGKTHSEETKTKMKNSKIGMYDGKKNPSYGKHWITNGTENKLIKKEEVPIGWRKGRV